MCSGYILEGLVEVALNTPTLLCDQEVQQHRVEH